MAESLVLTAINDCWSRIGIRGDRSCPQLSSYLHCHHCPVYADAARQILDRYPVQLSAVGNENTAHAQIDGLRQQEDVEAVLVFRLGESWLALPLAVLVEVVALQPIHSLPHRTAGVLLGVSNVRGTLVPCLALAALLQLPVTLAAPAQGRVLPRMLIIGAAETGNVVCPVDEVQGTCHWPLSLLQQPGEHPLSRALLHWQGLSVCLLDGPALLQAMHRSLS